MDIKHNVKRGVSLYSYQEEYHYNKLNLEDCIAVSSQMGIEGIEIIPDQMIHNSPFPTEDFYDKWHGMMKKYNVKPVCNDVFVNTTMYKNRRLSQRECAEALINEIKLAARMGAKMIRPVSLTASDAILRALPYAEKYDVAIISEIHAGYAFKNDVFMGFVEMMLKEKSPYLGLLPDMGIFCRRFPRIITDQFLRRGANPDLVAYIIDRYNNGKDMRVNLGALPPELAKFVIKEIDMEVIGMSGAFENYDISVLREYMPYIKNIHAKFYEMSEDYVEYSIPYDEIIPFLIDEGYNGYLCSEYEGNRFIHDAFPVDSIEQVRRHHVMMKKLLEAKTLEA